MQEKITDLGRSQAVISEPVWIPQVLRKRQEYIIFSKNEEEKMKGIYRSTVQAICVIFLGILFGVTAHAKNLNLQQIKALSYKQFELREGDKLYEVYLFSEDGEEQVATIENTLAWGGIYDGDTIVTGHFKLAYALKGTQEYKIYDLDELLDGEQVTLDITSQYINKISNNNQGISDFLTFFIPECSTGGELYVYEIINGSLHAIPFSVNGATSPYIWVAITNKQGAEFSAIGNLKYKGVLFSNANVGGYFMNIYKYIRVIKSKYFWIFTHL